MVLESLIVMVDRNGWVGEIGVCLRAGNGGPGKFRITLRKEYMEYRAFVKVLR